MMLKDMPVVTIEQIVLFREQALRLEEELAQVKVDRDSAIDNAIYHDKKCMEVTRRHIDASDKCYLLRDKLKIAGDMVAELKEELAQEKENWQSLKNVLHDTQKRESALFSQLVEKQSEVDEVMEELARYKDPALMLVPKKLFMGCVDMIESDCRVSRPL